MKNNQSQIAAAQDDHARALKKINELLAREWHLASVGLGNCRAAQAIRRELNEQLLTQSAALANANFNPNEPRDWHGQWTNNGTGTVSNKPSLAKPAIAAHPSTEQPGAAKGTTVKPGTTGHGTETKAAPATTPPLKIAPPTNKPAANPTNKPSATLTKKPPLKPAQAPPIPPDPENPPTGASQSEREQFARDIMKQFEAWKKANKCCDLDPGTLVAQWMYESGWGMKGAGTVKNLGGLSGAGPAGTLKDKSHNYRKYHDFSEFYRDYTNLICNSPRFSEAIGKKGREYLELLKKAHYDVSDAEYVKHVMEIYRQLRFK